MLRPFAIRSASFALLFALAACAPGPAQQGVNLVAGCSADPDCPANFFCVAGACQAVPAACKSYGDCNSTDACAYGRCVPGCAIAGCQNGQICDSTSRACVDSSDAGASSSADGGAVAGDGGTVGSDGGVVPGDGGTVGSDGGVVPGDGGMVGPDGGVVPDGGGAGDGGASGAPDGGGAGANGVTNGGFETGDLTGWTATGVASVVSVSPHSGNSCAQLGSSQPSSDSTLAQQVTLGAGSPQLTLWYKMVCNDTAQFDWAMVTVSTPGGTVLATPLAMTCTSVPWTQVSADLSAWAGQTVVVTLVNHDDGNSGDASYADFDDVAVAGAVGGTPDFTLGASPAAATGAGSANIAAVAGAGFDSSIVLAVSGAPSGAGAFLSSSSISANGSATLSLTPGSAASGTYSITVTGTSGALSHAASVSWTIVAAAPPGFVLAATPASLSGTGTSNLSVSPINGFAGAVSLVVAGAPGGASATLDNSSIGGGSGSATLSLNAGTAAGGTYSITVTGSSGGLSHSAQVSWTIASACTTDKWSGWPSSFMSNNCSQCHGWATSYSGVSARAGDCQTRIQSGNMPLSGSVSDADRNRIVQWLSCGLPQ